MFIHLDVFVLCSSMSSRVGGFIRWDGSCLVRDFMLTIVDDILGILGWSGSPKGNLESCMI